jgi:phosphoribosyl 1,2-cyclic phosphodiesterase
MPLYFQSLRSSSRGNCLLLWTDRTRVIIDCGLGSMKRTRELLGMYVGSPMDIDALVVSHMHSDHISYYPLRVFENEGIPVRIHESCLPQLKEKHFNGYGFSSLKLRSFADRDFRVGDMTFSPFEVPHNPVFPTYGFIVKYKSTKAVIAADFNGWGDLLGRFIDSDFIFVESNHDLELLRQNYNPNSRFHMPNPQTGKLLCSVRNNSSKAPKAVMLGHLSLIRNEPQIALREIESSFASEEMEMDFELLAAPGLTASGVVTIDASG